MAAAADSHYDPPTSRGLVLSTRRFDYFPAGNDAGGGNDRTLWRTNMDPILPSGLRRFCWTEDVLGPLASIAFTLCYTRFINRIMYIHGGPSMFLQVSVILTIVRVPFLLSPRYSTKQAPY